MDIKETCWYTLENTVGWWQGQVVCTSQSVKSVRENKDDKSKKKETVNPHHESFESNSKVHLLPVSTQSKTNAEEK